MWAMIPMLRVFSRLNLRGMWKVSLCLLRLARGAGEKNGPLGPVAITWRTARRTGLCLECLHGGREGPARRAHRHAQRPAAKPHGSSVPLGFRACRAVAPPCSCCRWPARRCSSRPSSRRSTTSAWWPPCPRAGRSRRARTTATRWRVIAARRWWSWRSARCSAARARRRSRWSLLGAAALAVALLVDLPDVHETGLIGQTYDAARAEPRAASTSRSRAAARRCSARR